MKRRKKSTPASEPAPAPLQPAYFDADPAAAKPATEPEEIPKAETAEPEESGSEVESPAAENVEPTSDAEGRPRRRRRRGRGGRGRNRATPVPATAAAEQPSAETGEASAVESAEPASAKPVSAPPSPATPRAPKGVVVLAIGLPGSGKSSWFKRHNITPLSSDLLRALLFDDATEQRFQDLVFSNLRSMLKARLIARRPMNYVDATNLTPHDRHGWIKMAKDFGYEVQAVFFDVPVEVCLERNQRRARVVAEDVMRRMAAKLKAPTFEEGFSKITVVRVKHKPE